MKIFKYLLYPSDSFELELPKGAKILTVQVQFEKPQIWALVDPNADNEKRQFRMIGTGHEIKEKNLTYIGTFQMMGGHLVWHLFEVKKNG